MTVTIQHHKERWLIRIPSRWRPHSRRTLGDAKRHAEQLVGHPLIWTMVSGKWLGDRPSAPLSPDLGGLDAPGGRGGPESPGGAPPQTVAPSLFPPRNEGFFSRGWRS